MLCSRAFLYSLCFILLYRRFTCFGSILRNLSFCFPPEFFGAWLPRFLFVCCSVAGGIKISSRNLCKRLSASTLCSNALVFPHVAGRGGGKLKAAVFLEPTVWSPQYGASYLRHNRLPLWRLLAVPFRTDTALSAVGTRRTGGFRIQGRWPQWLDIHSHHKTYLWVDCCIAGRKLHIKADHHSYSHRRHHHLGHARTGYAVPS